MPGLGGGDIGGNAVAVAVVKQHRAVNQILESFVMHILGLGLFLGFMVHLFQEFKGFNRVDAFYAAVVTITTVGYGDKTPSSKEKGILLDEILQTCILIAVRYFVLHTTLGGILDDVCDLACHWNWVDTRKRTIGLILSLVSLGIFIGGGAIVISIIEEKNWKISIYHSMTSISTVGYGDQVFTKEKGKIFAIIWLLLGVPICEKSVGFLHQLLAKCRTLLASFIGNVVWTVVTFVAKAFWMLLRLVGNLVLIVVDFWFTGLQAFGAFLWRWWVYLED